MPKRTTNLSGPGAPSSTPKNAKKGGRPQRGPSYLGPKNGRAYCYLRDPEGKRRQIILGDYDSPASWRRFADITARVLEGLDTRDLESGGATGNSASYLVEDLVARFLLWARDEYGDPSGEFDACKAACKPLLRLYGDLPAPDFSPKKLKRVREDMISCGWVRASINRQVGRIRRAFKWGAAEELVPGRVLEDLRCLQPLKRGKSAAPESREVLPVDWSTVEATLPHLTAIPKAIVLLMWHTGARPSEICSARRADIEFREEIWILRPAQHKTLSRGKSREVFLGPKAQDILRPFLTLDANAYLFRPEDSEAERRAEQRANRETPLTPSQRERDKRARSNPQVQFQPHYDSHALRKAVTRAARRAKVEHWTPYQLRHAFATRVRKHFDLECASVLLGHSDVEMSKVYAERDHKRAIQAAAMLG